MKYVKHTGLLLVVEWLLLFCMAIPSKADKTIYLLADIHVMGPSLLDSSDNMAWQEELAGHRKMQDLSVPIFDLLVEQILNERPDVLLIAGDLTKDGEEESHEYVLKKLTEIRDSGIRVCVIPGNHDRGWMEQARLYADNTFTKIDGYSEDMFREAYTPFGYGEGSQVHDASLSYSTELFPGLTLIGIDTENIAHVTEETIDWVCQKAREAREKGDQVIAMAHHSLIPHFYGQESIMINSVIDTNEQLIEGLMDAGVQVVLTGHYHISDNTCHTDGQGRIIYDICTGSPLAYPCDYRILSFDDHFRQLKITTKSITDAAGMANFPDYAKGRLKTAFLRWAYDWLAEKSISHTISSALAESVANVFIIHAEGNEPDNPASAEAETLYDDILLFSPMIEEKDIAVRIEDICHSMKSMLGDYPSAEEQDHIVNDRELSITMPDNLSGIETVRDPDCQEASWHTLQGIRLQRRPNRPGIYLHNGKVVSRSR